MEKNGTKKSGIELEELGLEVDAATGELSEVIAAPVEETVAEMAEETTDEVLEYVSGVDLPLDCETYISNGRKYHGFYVTFPVFGKKQKLELRPKTNAQGQVDRNAYDILVSMMELHTDAAGKCVLTLHCEQSNFKGADGKRRKMYTYTVSELDELTGVTFSVALQPYGASNKMTIEAIVNQKLTALGV